MAVSKGPIALLACEAGKPFAEKLAAQLKEKYGEENTLVPVKETHFGSSEIKTEILESVRGKDVYIVQDIENSVCGQWEEVSPEKVQPVPPVEEGTSVKVFRTYTIDENYRSLITLIDAARRSDAKSITIIVPTFPYARQHKAIGRESITASVVARELEQLGVERVMTLDIHKPEVGGFFRKTILDNFMPGRRMMDHLKKLPWYDKKMLVVSSADQGGVPRANFFAQTLGAPVVTIYKQRDYSQPNVVEKAGLLGNVQWVSKTQEQQLGSIKELAHKPVTEMNQQVIFQQCFQDMERIKEVLHVEKEGMDVVIPEDMICTGGTIVKACELLIKKGARSVMPLCSLPLFNGKAVERMNELFNMGMIKGVMGTNAVYHGNDFAEKNPWYIEVPIDDMFAEAIYRINHMQAITDLLN